MNKKEAYSIYFLQNENVMKRFLLDFFIKYGNKLNKIYIKKTKIIKEFL